MVKRFAYTSGSDVRPGDRIRYRGHPGTVDFVAAEKTGDAAIDWYVDQFPGGGFMINAETFGNVFLTSEDIDEFLELVERSE